MSTWPVRSTHYVPVQHGTELFVDLRMALEAQELVDEPS
jgi:hypothetical protein